MRTILRALVTAGVLLLTATISFSNIYGRDDRLTKAVWNAGGGLFVNAPTDAGSDVIL